jgi:hypothetical protein
VPSYSEVGSDTELAHRVKSILATRQLTLHQASQSSSKLFGRGSPYYLPHNFYYDLSHGHFSPSLFQFVALGHISNYRLRDWFRVFGFDIEAIPRLQIQLRSKRTGLLESTLDDPNLRIPWFRNLHTGNRTIDIAPLTQLLEWTEPRRVGSLLMSNDERSLYGPSEATVFPPCVGRPRIRADRGAQSRQGTDACRISGTSV